jgi:ribonuclease HII
MSIPAFCRTYQRGIPMKDRDETTRVVNTLIGTTAAANVSSTNVVNGEDDSNTFDMSLLLKKDLSSVYGEGPYILSDIPKSCQKRPIVIGIDEAGRGSVLGPMIYGMCFWYADAVLDDDAPTTTGKNHNNDQNQGRTEAVIIPKDFNDSKQLNETQRNTLFDTILQSPHIGFGIRIFPASEISRNMLRGPQPYNLNQMSHNAAIAMIRSLHDLQQHPTVQVQTCYIDTVGNATTYQQRLQQEFPNIEFVVESKADLNYPPCSAASIGTYIFYLSILLILSSVVPAFLKTNYLISHTFIYIMINIQSQWQKWYEIGS